MGRRPTSTIVWYGKDDGRGPVGSSAPDDDDDDVSRSRCGPAGPGRVGGVDKGGKGMKGCVSLATLDLIPPCPTPGPLLSRRHSCLDET